MKKEYAKKTLISCLLAIMLCSTMLIEVTYSWFTSSVFNKENRVEAASYEVGVTAEIPAGEDGSYTFAEDSTISFSLTASGTASTGYCAVYIVKGETEEICCYTAPIAPGNETPYVIEFTAVKDTVIRFQPCWGADRNSEVPTIADNGAVNLIGEPAEGQ